MAGRTACRSLKCFSSIGADRRPWRLLGQIGAEWHAWPWPGWVLGFLLFRFFDIVKPPPVSWADRMEGPLGVMLDDIVAGVLTALIAVVAAGVAHGWF